MTEQEWFGLDEPDTMLDYLLGKVSDRKLWLYGTGCVRRIWRLLTDPRSREAIEIIERYADGQAAKEDLRSARDMADVAADCTHGGPALAVYDLTDRSAHQGVRLAARRTAGVIADDTGSDVAAQSEGKVQVWLLKDIFGTVFRSVVVDPCWLTSTVVSLAQGIYADRAFDRMPILADALQDAGCDNADILDHCRDTNATHVRGCWVVDLLTGRE